MHHELGVTVRQRSSAVPIPDTRAGKTVASTSAAQIQANDDRRGHDCTGRTCGRPGTPAQSRPGARGASRRRSAPRLLPYLSHHAPTQAPRRSLLGARSAGRLRRRQTHRPHRGRPRTAPGACGTPPNSGPSQRTQDIRRGVSAAIVRSGHLVSLRHGREPSVPRATRSLLKPSLIRPFTVPGGSDSISAISTW